jgi:peptidoglycan/LPS O-acetylase OafA/YrhL
MSADGPTNRGMMNFAALDGVRCLGCLAVILFHVHFMEGGFFFPSTHSCMQEIRHIPVAGRLLFDVSFHMYVRMTLMRLGLEIFSHFQSFDTIRTIFWLISGFLCEHQLSKLKESDRNGVAQYGRFLLNRLLRLYPLYALLAIIVYFDSISNHLLPDDAKCNLPVLVGSLFFFSPHHASKCALIGWSVSVDVHGYMAIVLLSALVPSTRLRKYVCQAIYALSFLSSAWGWLSLDPKLQLHLEQNGVSGLENIEGYERPRIDLGRVQPIRFYPDIDFDNPWISTHFQAFMRDLYTTSIHKHGSAMLLGSLLYMNLKDRQGKPQNSLLKVNVAFLILVFTKMRFSFTGISMYLLMDVILTLKADKSRFSAIVLSGLSNRLWSTIAPYTYGIYLTHFSVIMTRTRWLFPKRASLIKAGGDPCDDYNLPFILTETVKVFVIALLISIALHYTIERPFTSARKHWLGKESVGSSAKAKT